MKNIQWLLIASGAVLLASCSSDEPAGIGDKVAARVSANIGTMDSRAHDTSWDNGDAIGISTTSSGKTQYTNKKYTTSGDGTFSHAGGETSGIFFQDTQTVTFSAYYPYSGSEGSAVGTISSITTEDQSNQKAFDFLYATGATANRNDPALNFTGDASFKHKMTRLVLKLKTDTESGFTAGDVANGTYSLSGIKHSGSFNTATGEAIATGTASTDWAITATPTTSGNERVYCIILYPQNGATLTFKATISGATYTASLSPQLAAGNSYIYTITMKKTGFSASSGTISGWNDVNGGNIDADMNGSDKSGQSEQSTQKVGDYLYTDGTTSTTKTAGKTVAGIVFYVGQHDNDLSDYTSTGIGQAKCHGYAVALNDATQSCHWSTNTEFKNTNTSEDDWSGYDNQQILKNDGISKYPAAQACANYSTAVANSSGWFLPSLAQLKYLYDNYNDENSAVRKALTAEGTWFTASDNNFYYWTSTEKGEGFDNALVFTFGNGYTKDLDKSIEKNAVRPIIAF